MKTLSFKEYLKQRLSEEEIAEIRNQAQKEVRQMTERKKSIRGRKIALLEKIIDYGRELEITYNAPFTDLEFLKEENSDIFRRLKITKKEESLIDDFIQKELDQLDELVKDSISKKQKQKKIAKDLGDELATVKKFQKHIDEKHDGIASESTCLTGCAKKDNIDMSTLVTHTSRVSEWMVKDMIAEKGPKSFKSDKAQLKRYRDLVTSKLLNKIERSQKLMEPGSGNAALLDYKNRDLFEPIIFTNEESELLDEELKGIAEKANKLVKSMVELRAHVTKFKESELFGFQELVKYDDHINEIHNGDVKKCNKHCSGSISGKEDEFFGFINSISSYLDKSIDEEIKAEPNEEANLEKRKAKFQLNLCLKESSCCKALSKSPINLELLKEENSLFFDYFSPTEEEKALIDDDKTKKQILSFNKLVDSARKEKVKQQALKDAFPSDLPIVRKFSDHMREIHDDKVEKCSRACLESDQLKESEIRKASERVCSYLDNYNKKKGSE